jgi:anti-anti-sigma factor
MTITADIASTERYELSGDIAVVEERGERIIRLSGEIDSNVVAEYEGNPRTLADRCAPASVIDTSGVTFLDGRGLGFLVRRARASRRAGGRPVLRRPANVVRRLVDLAGATNEFTITR